MPKPVIDKKKCKNCGDCMSICPVNVFGKENQDVVVKKPNECIGCRACEAQCQQGAVKVED